MTATKYSLSCEQSGNLKVITEQLVIYKSLKVIIFNYQNISRNKHFFISC